MEEKLEGAPFTSRLALNGKLSAQMKRAITGSGFTLSRHTRPSN